MFEDATPRNTSSVLSICCDKPNLDASQPWHLLHSNDTDATPDDSRQESDRAADGTSHSPVNCPLTPLRTATPGRGVPVPPNEIVAQVCPAGTFRRQTKRA